MFLRNMEELKRMLISSIPFNFPFVSWEGDSVKVKSTHVQIEFTKHIFEDIVYKQETKMGFWVANIGITTSRASASTVPSEEAAE